MKSVCILSGGLDSTTLLYKLIKEGKEVKAISFFYGQRHSKELEMAVKTCDKLNIEHKVINLEPLKSIMDNSALTGDVDVPEGHYEDETMKKTVVPNRNMIFASIAIAYAVNIEADEVALGVHAGDHAIYPDCRPEFIDALRAVAKIANYRPIEVYAPFIDMSKADIVGEGIELEVDYSLTHTCYKGEEVPCGLCGSCRERGEAFYINKTQDPLTIKL